MLFQTLLPLLMLFILNLPGYACNEDPIFHILSELHGYEKIYVEPSQLHITTEGIFFLN